MMDIIYSRPKIKIKKRYKIIITIIVLIIIIHFLLNKIVYPLFSSKCIYQAQVLVTQISSQETEKIMQNYTYKDLVNIEEDSEGNVTFLESNVVLINRIKAEIENKIQNRFIETTDTNIDIRLGSLTGSRLLSSLGPNIVIQVLPTGTITSTLETEFYSVGVNQSIHRIFLDICCTVSIMSPFETVSQAIQSKVLLSESVIVGNTPENYYKIDGMSSEEQVNFIP